MTDSKSFPSQTVCDDDDDVLILFKLVPLSLHCWSFNIIRFLRHCLSSFTIIPCSSLFSPFLPLFLPPLKSSRHLIHCLPHLTTPIFLHTSLTIFLPFITTISFTLITIPPPSPPLFLSSSYLFRLPRPLPPPTTPLHLHPCNSLSEFFT